MIAHPSQLLTLLLLGIAAFAVLSGALYLLLAARRPRRIAVPTGAARPIAGDGAAHRPDVVAEQRSRRRRATTVAVAFAMLLSVFAGKYLVAAFYAASGEGPGRPAPESTRIRGASGAELAVHRYGSGNGPVLVFTHGWGADRRDWEYAIGALPAGFDVVAWDLPGLGASTGTASNDYSVPTMAADLDSVVSSLKGRPVILVGHSVGGILNLEYARRFPEKLGREVRGIVQANTTFTNPVETKKGAELSRKLQEPVFEPLLHVIAWTSPVVRAFGWLAYQSGLAHVQLAMQSFAGAQTWEQLDEMARYAYRSSPGVIARGVLGMLHWDGSDVLPRIDVPTLIISGNEDTTTLPLASDRMQRDIPSSTRLSVSPAAHLGPVEQYRTYAEAIGSFARKVVGDAAAR